MTVALTLDATDRARLAGDLDRLGAGLTALAGLLLKPVASEVLDHIRDAGMLADWPSQADPASVAGLALLAESLAAGESEVDIRQDYNQLFVGPERMTAPPYESVHRSQERLIFEQETFLVRAAYAEFGLAAPRLNQDPDDHIGLELSFVGTLCVRGLDALDAGDDVELSRLLEGARSFLEAHLLAWGPTCFAQIEAHAKTAFYRGVGALGRGILVDAGVTFGP